MIKFQPIDVLSGQPVGDPGDLPPELVGLDAASLADISAAVDPCPPAFVGKGFLPVEVADPNPPARKCPRFDFLYLRMTQAERIALRTKAELDPIVYDFKEALDYITEVELDNALTVGGLQYMEMKGYIAAGRAAEILA